MSYLLNTWYVAGWAEELAQDALLARTLLEKPIVFFRDSQGVDRCPHRFAPLHIGKIVGDSVQCPYHGLRFGGGGQCTHNPQGKGNIPKAACVRSCPVVERHAAIRIWPGDPTLANDALIPDFSLFEQAPRLEDPIRAGRLRHLYDSRIGKRTGTSRHVLDRRRESPKRPVHTLLFSCQERTPGARSLRIFYESSSARCRYGTVISRTC